jgi:hypothetical protein
MGRMTRRPPLDDERQLWLDRLLREGVPREEAEAFLDGAELNPDDENEAEFLCSDTLPDPHGRAARSPADARRAAEPKWTQAWVKDLTPEEREWLESLPIDDDLAPGETEVILISPVRDSPPKT